MYLSRSAGLCKQHISLFTLHSERRPKQTADMKNARSKFLKSLIASCKTASLLNRRGDQDADAILQLKKPGLRGRRTFLAAIGSGTLTTLGISCISKRKEQASGDRSFAGRQPEIAIVGGGIAGLTCAYHLRKSGIKANIYEAGKVAGGRISTKRNIFGDGLYTEFGGEFIDSGHEDMLDLVRAFDLELDDTFADITAHHLVKDTFFFNGRVYSERDVIYGFREAATGIESDLSKCGIRYDTPYARQLDHISLEEYTRALPCPRWLQDLLICAYTAEYGLDGGQQSCLNLVGMIGTGPGDDFSIFGDSDERYKVKGGNYQIIERLSGGLGDRIAYDHRLTSVRQAGSRYALSFEGRKPVVADYVVLTLPFSVLKEVDFAVADMRPEKKACIHQLGYGQNNKLILGFAGRPWREGNSPSAGCLFHRDIQNGWDSTPLQHSKGPGTYTVFLGGSASLRLAGQAGPHGLPESTVTGYVEKLGEVYPGSSKNYTGTYRTALWSTHPFVKASYACYKTGQWTSLSGLEALPVGNIFFAGEHCSPNFQGFMNGGAETGRKAAENIARRLEGVACRRHGTAVT